MKRCRLVFGLVTEREVYGEWVPKTRADMEKILVEDIGSRFENSSIFLLRDSCDNALLVPKSAIVLIEVEEETDRF